VKIIEVKERDDIPKDFTGIAEYLDGSKQWFKDGKLHRINGPAALDKGGTIFWYQNGKRHRINGPAVEWASESKSWYQNGKLHRTDGPAYEHYDGSVEYYINDEQTYKEAVEVFNVLFPDGI
jgi:hypothetical protein